LLSSEPLQPSVRAALLQPRDWSFEGLQAAAGIRALSPSGLRFSPPARRWQAAYYSRSRSNDWQRYLLRVTISGLGGTAVRADARTTSSTGRALVDPTSASILFGYALAPSSLATVSVPHYAVSVSAGRVSLTVQTSPRGKGRVLASARLMPRSRHTASLAVTGDRVPVSVDSRASLPAPIAPASHWGIGLGSGRSGRTSRPVRVGAMRT